MAKWRIYNEDVREWAKSYSRKKFHALLCDPPYHLSSIVKRFGKNGSAPAKYGTDGAFSRASAGFMGKTWDGGDVAFDPDTWAAFGELLYPGAFGMAFSASRNWHRLAVAIEDAGFIIHPTIFGWAYGSGFPKATRVKGHKEFDSHRYGLQALKPALEPIIVFQKPYEGRPVDDIVQTGAGALNIDGGRIPSEPYIINTWDDNAHPFGDGAGNPYTSREVSGRWPANFFLDDEAARRLDEQSGEIKGVVRQPTGHGILDPGTGWNQNSMTDTTVRGYSDTGGASRFFFRVSEQLDESDPVRYVAKAASQEREDGLTVLPCLKCGQVGTHTHKDDKGEDEKCRRSNHPTVKPLALAKYLATLLLPPAEYAPRRILVPFSGVGSEMIGAGLAGWEQIVGVEFDTENNYVDIANARLEHWLKL